MIIISTLIGLLGLLLNLIGLIGLYKNRENIFGTVSLSDIKKITKQLKESPETPEEDVTQDVLKKVTRANDFFICIVAGFLLEFFAVALTLFTLISLPH